MGEFRYYKDYGNVVRLYFTDGSMTLSKLKTGPLLDNIIEKCKRDGKKYRNDFKIIDDYVEIYCWERKTQTIKTMYLDLDDWEKYCECYFSCQNWNKVLVVYNKERWRCHRLVMGLPRKIDRNIKENMVDHINRNPLDNRKRNLRIVDNQTNSKNHGFFNKNNKSSGVYGVSRTIDKMRWRVRFGKDEDDIYYKEFDKLSDAVEYRYKKGKELGFLFSEGSTTIESYINELRLSSK